MPYTVKVEHPHFPEGTIFNVGNLDRVPNGGSLEVDEEMERLFIMSQGQTLEDAYANDATINVSGSSALDDNERNSLVEAYGPQPEETVEVTDLGGDQQTTETNNPSWLSNTGADTTTTGDGEGDVNA